MNVGVRFSLIAIVVAIAAVTSIIPLSAQSFTLSVSPATQTITLGETATFNVQITPENGFDATVFLSVQSSLPGVELNFPGGTAINPPYSVVTLTARSITDTGIIVITLTGTNTALKSTGQATLNVVKYQNPQWKIVPDNEIYRMMNMFLDRNGNIVGISYSTAIDKSIISKFASGVWTSDTIALPYLYKDFSSLDYRYDSEGDIWAFVTYVGVYRWRNDLLTLYSSQNSSLTSGLVYDFTMDTNNEPMVMMFNFTVADSGRVTIQRFANNSWTNLYQCKVTLKAPPMSSMPNSMCIDSSGRIWFSAFNTGLIRFKDKEADTISLQEMGFSDGGTGRMICTPDGKVWVKFTSASNYSQKVIVFDNTDWKEVQAKIGDLMAVDSKSNVWSSFGSTLYRNDGITTFEYNSSNSPLPSKNQIKSLVIDNNDNIWIRCNGAAYIFNPNGLVGIPLVLSAEEHTPAATALTVFPNPTSANVTLRGISGNEIIITDVLGRDVLTVELPTGTTEQIIETSSLPEGIYLCRAGNTTLPIIVRR